ncbi:MAG: hypothetical protein KKB51_12095 [Candidatus Riflebacteria bacterium]|nr:hypothetical protein [Candidatus Riflebacteria bacterium]
MRKLVKNSLLMLLITLICHSVPVTACDDTLVMLLTAQNPGSEFSKVIRSFSTDLTALGLALKGMEKASYDSEMNKVMESWLEFSKKYMTNPPTEARNDLRWAAKTSETARSIGEIRRLVNEKRFMDAHDRILDLNSKIGLFFEAFGVSDEKQLFITTSANLTSLERALLNNDKVSAASLTKEIENNLKDFTPLLEGKADNRGENAKKLLLELAAEIGQSQSLVALDAKLQQLKTIFEEMRAQILLHEWFPSLKN